MCGIAGIATSADRLLPDLTHRVVSACWAIHARGPDDEGVFVSADGRVGLGNRRLAVRDLSPAGHMPMSTAAGDIWVTYNGELYNASEVRSELERLGYQFRSSGDTEVLLYGYVAWGDEVVYRLRGMFAFVIHDARGPGRLLVARDQLGIKPLYYTAEPDGFYFASECKALLAMNIGSEISSAGLVAYLELGSVPAPVTIYRHVRALESGHFLSVSLDHGRVVVSEPRKYWHLPGFEDAEARPMDYLAAVESTRAVLLDSVRRHLVSDVPLGVFLSGGVDSASLVALMRLASPNSVIRTCSVVFEDNRFDESKYANLVAREFGTEHLEVPVSESDVERELDDAIAALDQPSNDGLNVYFVSQAARGANLTVALSGLGGDELFGGYSTVRRVAQMQRLASVANRIPSALALAGAGLRAVAPFHRYRRTVDWMNLAGADQVTSYLGLRGLFSPGQVRELVRPEVVAEAHHELDLIDLTRRAGQLHPQFSSPEVVSRLELTSYMRHQLLRDSDVMSMAHSLEVRVPFVDHVVVEHVLEQRLSRYQRGLPKQLLRDAVPSVPSAIRNRRVKQGFTFPLGQWLAGPLRPRLRELISVVDDRCYAFLRPGAAESVWKAFDDGKVHWSRPWALAALCTALKATPLSRAPVGPPFDRLQLRLP